MPPRANTLSSGNDLVTQAIDWLKERLPRDWQVRRAQATTLADEIEIGAARGPKATIAVEAKSSFEPRDVQQLIARVRLRRNAPTVLVIAPWLSLRAQNLLATEEINYLDLTGNARLRLDDPALYLDSAGARRNPAPAARGRARLSGPKAGRFVRVLADVRPPYGVREIAKAANLNPGYVSRLLDTLDREALIDRGPRGSVDAVDVGALLRRWAKSYEVLKTNEADGFIAPAGPADTLERLAEIGRVRRVVVSGSFAAVRLAPVAAPAFLVVYCDDVPSIASELGLLPADVGANVALLRPFDPVVWAGTSDANGVSYAAVSQVAVDCLTGNGRMPAEGEALLEWMTEDDGRWRVNTLADLPAIPAAA